MSFTINIEPTGAATPGVSSVLELICAPRRRAMAGA